MYLRSLYLSYAEKWKDKHVIKVATGIRRSGKSSVFLNFIEYFKSLGVTDSQIIYLNLEDFSNVDLLKPAALHEYVISKMTADKNYYLFIDEIQQCKDFEKVIDSLFLSQNLDIYITGSNAWFLSGELATLLSGRYIMIPVLPLSFQEYFQFNDVDPEDLSLTEKNVFFSRYCNEGQFPYIPFLRNDPVAISAYIEGIYNTVLIKDVATREKITDISLLQRIVRTICSNVGSPISSKRIADTLISSGRKVSYNTVDNYIHALCDAFIFYEVQRFDVKGNELLKTFGKYYLADTGLRTVLISSKELDFGHVIENIVYLELVRRGYQVCIGKIGDKEIDFVAKSGQKIEYYQVSASILDESTRAREIAPLQAVKDNFPKYLLTLDEIQFGSLNGIIQKNIVEWLLEKG